MASRDAQDELDEVLDAILQAIPPERHHELRALLRTSRRRPRTRSANDPPPATPDEPASADETTPAHPSPPPSSPPLTPEPAPRIAAMLATMRAAGAPGDAPLALRTGRGAGGEGLARGAGAKGQNARIAVRVGREPLGHTVRLSDVAPEPLRWLWPGRIPVGKITVLDGDPGLGKSTLLCGLAARISRGDSLPGDLSDSAPTAPRGVLLFSAEDDVFDTIRPRIDAAGGDPQRIAAFVAVPDGTETGRPFALPRDLPILEAVVARLDAALVVFDPLVAYLPAGVSPNSDQHVRHAMAALKASAERTGAAIVVVRHLNKTMTANPLYRGVGSIGIIGAARSGLLLAADPDDPERRILALAKGNLARPAASLAFRLEDVPGATVARVVWDGESPWTANQLLHAQGQAEDDGDEARSAVDDARAWLREALAAGPRAAMELRHEAAAHGIVEKTLYAARKAEGISAYKERVPNGRWFWLLAITEGERELEEAPSPSP
jgi:hypothetical protein